MKELKDLIEAKAEYLGNGILKADSFINHQLLPGISTRMGQAFAEGFKAQGVTGATKIITAEVSGIAPALVTAQAMDIPMVFARKKRPAFMNGPMFEASAISRTKGVDVSLYISSRYLGPTDRVVIVDDFLATASTLEALCSIVEQSGATLLAIGCIIEKVFERGRQRLECLNVPIITLAKIDLVDSGNSFIVS
jgi:xanthine phosphoribosyltransferase